MTNYGGNLPVRGCVDGDAAGRVNIGGRRAHPFVGGLQPGAQGCRAALVLAGGWLRLAGTWGPSLGFGTLFPCAPMMAALLLLPPLP